MENSERSISKSLAKIVSIVFHPLLIPLYGLLVIFLAPTLFWYIPFKVKKILFLVMATNNVLIPLSQLPFFRYRNIIKSWTMETRKERLIPMLSVSLFYSITSIIMFRLQIPVFIKAYAFSISFIAIALTVVNFWWKISLHSAGVGVLTGIIIVLSLKMQVSLILFIIPVLIISGAVLASRLKLNSHNSAEVYSGYLTGFAGMLLFMAMF